MEVVGEFLGFSTDKGIWAYFRDHWSEWFPGLGSRANFAKQISNLWAVKQQLQEKLARLLGAFDRPVHIIDGFPLPICGFKRAKGSANFKGQADYGYCAAKNETDYGFKGHLMIDEIGVVTGFTLTPANVSEREATSDMITPHSENSEATLNRRYLYTQRQFALMPQMRPSMPAFADNLVVLLKKTECPKLYCSDLRQRQRADLYVYPRHPQRRFR